MVRVDGTDNAGSLIRVRDLDKKYRRGSEEIHVLQGLNLDVRRGRLRGLHGPVRLGQDDAAQPARRPRRADLGHR